MNLCINPKCLKANNPNSTLFCTGCGSELLLEGKYQVTKILGSGGFGKTYTIQDKNNTIKVLKVLTNDNPKAIELFQQEARVLGSLSHPGIPKVDPIEGYFLFYPRNASTPLHCLIMEKIEGEDLATWIQKRGNRPISQSVAEDWLKELTEILQIVHQQQFFHRDIKPANIMLRTQGNLALIDFGTARQITNTYINKVEQGQVTGIVSMGYTAPEQMNGQAIPESDIFSLGRTFVFLLTGKEPTHPSIFNPLNNQLNWRKSTTHQISTPFADLIDCLMSYNASNRPSLAQILATLNNITQSPPTNRTNNSHQQPTLIEPPPPPPSPNQTNTRRGLLTILFWILVGSGIFKLIELYQKSITPNPIPTSGQKSPPTKETLIVSKKGAGKYSTITDAIKNAPPNSTIIVHSGTYQESLIIDKKITIIGKAINTFEPDIIIETENKACLTMMTDYAEIKNITFRLVSSTDNRAAIFIDQGELIIEDCDISSNSVSGIEILGTNTKAIIRRCKIHNNKASGIFFYQQAQGIVDNCQIYQNEFAGIEIKEQANPLIKDSHIYQGKTAGILIQKQGLGTIQNCRISDNAYPAIEIREQANPLIKNCEIYLGKQIGILIQKQGLGTIQNCRIYENAFSGIEIREQANPLIQKCQINSNREYGLYVHTSGEGKVENCDLSNNKKGPTLIINSPKFIQTNNIT